MCEEVQVHVCVPHVHLRLDGVTMHECMNCINIYMRVYIYISRFKTSIYTNKGIVLYKIYRRVINIHTWYFGTFNLNRVEILFLRRSYWKVF